MNRLLITADDYGLDPAINAGIEELAEAGYIDRVSIMAHRGASLDSVNRLVDSGVELGAHLVLVEEFPLLKETSPGGRPLLSNYRALATNLVTDSSMAGKLVQESHAQILRLHELGVPLTHVNSHQHVHLLPLLWKALRSTFNQWKLEVRAARTIRSGPPKQALVELSSALSVALWPLSTCTLVHPIGIELAGRCTLQGLSESKERIQRILQTGVNAELVVHPGHETQRLQSRYAHWNYRWEEEFRLLSSEAFRQTILEISPDPLVSPAQGTPT